MVHAIRFDAVGGPEVLKWEEVALGAPGPGEIRLRQEAVGLNYIDVYHRTGLYPVPLPAIPGLEGAGTVTAIGADVTRFAPGDRVAHAGGGLGAYAQERLIAADRVCALPDELGFDQGAAMMLKGLTAQYLLRRTYRVRPGDAILIHAAAGGVGQMVCQWARHLGATVIGTVGSEEKARLARAKGCDHTILYRNEDFVERVRDITHGRGVAVVYDSIGRETFLKSIDCLRPLGMLVSFGQSAGPVADFSPGLLARGGSLFLTRPSLMHYIADPADLRAMADELFAAVRQGVLDIAVSDVYPLAEAAAAHRALEARETTGSVVLKP